ncbi:MAG: ABC transporter permease, partial [Spirochaetia bacterium]|nr:ABC transporter permease [Spirochaetia bacterium]
MSENKQFVAQSRLIDEMSLKNRLVELVTKWEVILSFLFVVVFVFFSNMTPYFLDWFNLMNATFQFSEKAIMALPMIFIIMCGDIDISIASIIALCAYVIGISAEAGMSIPSLI